MYLSNLHTCTWMALSTMLAITKLYMYCEGHIKVINGMPYINMSIHLLRIIFKQWITVSIYQICVLSLEHSNKMPFFQLKYSLYHIEDMILYNLSKLLALHFSNLNFQVNSWCKDFQITLIKYLIILVLYKLLLN